MHPRRLYAHRGASAERPENTMPAFERAVELGVDALELDVHATADGRLVVVHDDTALRTCGVPAPWAELELAAARRLDAGWGFVAADGTRPFAGRGIRVPRFEEVLEAFPAHAINVDVKRQGARLLLDVVRAQRAEARVTIASFALGPLREIRAAGYGGETGLSQPEVAALLALPAIAWRALPRTGTAAQLPTRAGRVRFDRLPFIAKCHALGLRVDYWTIDDVDEARRLLALGADGIMTNDPAAIRPAFA